MEMTLHCMEIMNAEKRAADRRFGKKVILAGAIFGGILAVAIALMMDFLYADAMSGTWRDAIAQDLHRLFNASFAPDSFVVITAFLFILAFLAAVGAVMGSVFSLIIHRFLSMLTSS